MADGRLNLDGMQTTNSGDNITETANHPQGFHSESNETCGGNEYWLQHLAVMLQAALRAPCYDTPP